MVQDPLVERTVVLELERAQGMRDPLDRVGENLGEVVRGIDAPGVAGMGMGRVPDPVQNRVAQVEVSRRHVDTGPQHVRAVGKLPAPHPARTGSALSSDRTVPPGARPDRVG